MKKRKLFSIMLTAIITAAVLVGCGSKSKKTVSTDGSTSMEKVIGALGEAFEAANNGVTFTYNPTGSSSGIKAVLDGTCDIGLSSRDLKAEEKSQGLTGTVLAYDGIAIIVNPTKKPATGDANIGMIILFTSSFKLTQLIPA